MNEVKKCSLAGIGFTLEVEAYDELSNYIEALQLQYQGNPDGEEIIADIEARIAELILSVQDPSRTVGLALVRNIIQQMGSAEEIDSEGHRNEEPKAKRRIPRIPRRLYRDAEAGKVGGVCAGLGNYFDVDPVWVRLALFAPLILMLFSNIPGLWWLSTVMGNLFGVFLLGYLVMWFAIPVARTARQKLEMRGEKITAESIDKFTGKQPNDVDGKQKEVVANTLSGLGLVVMIILKVVAAAITAGVVICAAMLIIGLVVVWFEPSGSIYLGGISKWLPSLGLLWVLVPCMTLVYVLMCLIASRRPHGKTLVVALVAWILLLIGLITTVICDEQVHQLFYEEISYQPAPTNHPDNLMDQAEEVEEQALEMAYDAVQAAQE